MIIKIKRQSLFWDASFSDGTATIKIELMDKTERDALAIQMANALYGLAPSTQAESDRWIRDIFESQGIDIADKEEGAGK